MSNIDGISHSDIINGTEGIDTINGLEGDDVIDGRGGIDLIYGGSGNDVIGLRGFTGTDNIFGGDGNDWIIGSSFEGSVTLDGGLGDDRILAGVFQVGTPNRFTIFGGEGNDQVLIGGGGGIEVGRFDANTSNLIDLGAGDDLAILVGGNTIVTLGSGRDTIQYGYSGPDGHPTPQNLNLGITSRFIINDFNPAEDRISTNGAFTFPYYNGIDSPFNGISLGYVQVGNDVILRSLPNSGSSVDLITFRNQTVSAMSTVKFGDFAVDGSTPIGFYLTGTSGNDGLDLANGLILSGATIGGSGGDTIRGLGGDDLILGFQGNDILYGDEGVDNIVGGFGNDQIFGGAGDDQLFDSAGADQIFGGEGNDNLVLSLIDQPLDRIPMGWADSRIVGPISLMDGGTGNDRLAVDFRVGGLYTQSKVFIHGGSGDDSIQISANGFGATFGAEPATISSLDKDAIDISLGSGADRLSISGFALGFGAPIVVRDFNATEDQLTLDFRLFLSNYSFGANPYSSGHAKFVQEGQDSVLYIDRNGGGNNYRAFVRFEGISRAEFVNTSLAAFDFTVAPLVGSPALVSGTTGADFLQPPGNWSGFGSDG